MPRPAADASPPQRTSGRRVASLIVAVAALAIGGAWGWAQLERSAAVGPLPADRTEVIARRIGVVFADAERVWRRVLRSEADRAYEQAELVLYTRELPSPCVGAAFATGPFYCRLSRTTGFDLAYFDALGARLQRQAELGWALTVARVVAAHTQGELGILASAERRRRSVSEPEREALELALGLQADCLTGVWASAAASALGPVPVGFYGEVVRISRNVATDRERAGLIGPPEADIFFAAGAPAEHEAAFAVGYAGGVLEACPLMTLPR